MSATQAELLHPPAVKEVALRPLQASDQVAMFERLARDASVPVEKLEKLIELQERIIRHNARAEYYAAFAAMQGELPVITERGEILVNGQLRSRYAKNEDIQEQIRPILQRHGFALSFRNEFKDGYLKIVGVLAHRSGHAEQDEFIAKPDDSGSKNAIQSLGSTRSYGQRYTTIALLNIATRGEDDDGAQHGKPVIEAPKGFEEWYLDLVSVADEGTEKLRKAWEGSRMEYRTHVMKTNPQGWNGLKAKAAKVKA